MIVKNSSHVWSFDRNFLGRFNSQTGTVMCSDFFLSLSKNWGTFVFNLRISSLRHSQAYFLGVANKPCFTVGKYSIYCWWRDPVLSLHDFYLFFKCLGRGPNVFPSVISVELRNSNGFWRQSDFFSKVRAEDVFVGFFWMEIHGQVEEKNLKKNAGFFLVFSCCWLFLFLSPMVWTVTVMNID